MTESCITTFYPEVPTEARGWLRGEFDKYSIKIKISFFVEGVMGSNTHTTIMSNQLLCIYLGNLLNDWLAI